ncbi:hypothetical protein [Candidatus Odyssella thessalonicensis]|uniref:hypothetical protein n=1 Tax=Candidatus Odyssella thessalonicensis TaxID=84647 RepID=UPI000225A939|nr:hypothetical protein [Candidatus Odyssella thessalonicensis]
MRITTKIRRAVLAGITAVSSMELNSGKRGTGKRHSEQQETEQSTKRFNDTGNG